MSGPFGTVLGFLHRLTGPTAGEGESDGQLLARFVARRDEAAFTGLLHRHGPMVLGLCRRALGNVQAAEDAFQATFLVLAKKAASIRRREAVGSWLYGVAYRIAARIREQDLRRRTAEARAVRPTEEGPDLDSAWRELQTVLDDALHRLPEKYRAPVLLCYLEGLTHEEAAARIGCPVGTVRSRLARGRQRLRDGLARRGLTMSATAFAAALAALPATA